MRCSGRIGPGAAPDREGRFAQATPGHLAQRQWPAQAGHQPEAGDLAAQSGRTSSPGLPGARQTTVPFGSPQAQGLVGEQGLAASREAWASSRALRRRQGSLLAENANRCCAGAGPQAGFGAATHDPRKRWPLEQWLRKCQWPRWWRLGSGHSTRWRDRQRSGWRRPSGSFRPPALSATAPAPAPFAGWAFGPPGHGAGRGLQQPGPPAATAASAAGGTGGAQAASAGQHPQQRQVDAVAERSPQLIENVSRRRPRRSTFALQGCSSPKQGTGEARPGQSQADRRQANASDTRTSAPHADPSMRRPCSISAQFRVPAACGFVVTGC